MAEPASISTGIASRYATAVFELAKDGKKIPAIEKDFDALGAALNDSADLRDLISSPIYSRDEQANAISAIAMPHAAAGGRDRAIESDEHASRLAPAVELCEPKATYVACASRSILARGEGEGARGVG